MEYSLSWAVSSWHCVGHVEFMVCVPFCSHWAVNANGSLVEYGVYTNEKMLQSLYRNSMPIFGISYSELLKEIIPGGATRVHFGWDV